LARASSFQVKGQFCECMDANGVLFNLLNSYLRFGYFGAWPEYLPSSLLV
jgi:hypothetical protein